MVGAIIVLIVVFLAIESVPALRQIGIGAFVADESWHPNSSRYNLVPMLWGTVLVTIGAVVLATPLGILSAVFRNLYAGRFVSRTYRRLIELLAGIPSVVYGFWGLVVLVPMIREIAPPGPSLLAGIIILTIMILPTVALLADAALESVPDEYIVAAESLGLSRYGRLRATLPAAAPGILVGVILAAGRAIGETMAVLMVCGNVVNTPGSVFEPVRTLTANIALEMAYAIDLHRSALFVSGLFLMALILALFMLTTRVQHRSFA